MTAGPNKKAPRRRELGGFYKEKQRGDPFLLSAGEGRELHTFYAITGL